MVRPAALRTFVCAVILFLVSSCSRSGRDADADAGCLADSIGTLQRFSTVPPCATDVALCTLKCKTGSAVSCLGLAYEAQKNENEDDAKRLFRRACLLGSANGCTNYAAEIWGGPHTDDELTCARRVFEKACSAKEPFACGMVGRLMLESSSSPSYAEGRRYLERACSEVGAFPCRVLARHLETGKLGSYEPERIRALLRKACADGDPDACGEPATADETFH